MHSSKRIGAIATLLILVLASIIGVIRPWTSDGPTPVQALESGEWHDALTEFYQGLAPGTGYVRRVEVYSRHGPAAELIKEGAAGYNPERYEISTVHTFDDDGRVQRLEAVTRDEAGQVLHEARLEGETIIERDHRENVPAAERVRETPIVPAASDVDRARESLINAATQRVERLLDSGIDEADIVEEGSTIRVGFTTDLPIVEGGEGSFTIPFVGDLDADSGYFVVTLDARTFRTLATELYAVHRDGSRLIVESWLYHEFEFVSEPALRPLPGADVERSVRRSHCLT